MKKYSQDTGRALPTEGLSKLLELAKERMTKLSDFFTLCEFLDEEKYRANFEENRSKVKFDKSGLQKVSQALESLSKWNAASIKDSLFKVFEEVGGISKRDFFVSLYIHLTGKPVGLPLFESMTILGKEKTLVRLK